MSAGSILRPSSRDTSDRARWSEGYAADRATSHNKNNAGYQIGNPAAYIRIQVHAVPPVEVYNDWIAKNIGAANSRHTVMTGSKLRRIVHMIRTGSSQADAARAVNLSQPRLGKWLARLPAELRP